MIEKLDAYEDQVRALQAPKKIPNSAFDIEYRTEWRDEVDFLAKRGIYYTIRKLEGEYNIPVYKYTKTADLFVALADFYLRRKRNAKSQATYKGKKFEQQSFIKKDGTLNEQFVNKELEQKAFDKPLQEIIQTEDDTE